MQLLVGALIPQSPCEFHQSLIWSKTLWMTMTQMKHVIVGMSAPGLMLASFKLLPTSSRSFALDLPQLSARQAGMLFRKGATKLINGVRKPSFRKVKAPAASPGGFAANSGADAAPEVWGAGGHYPGAGAGVSHAGDQCKGLRALGAMYRDGLV